MILKEIQDNRISKKIVESLYGKPIELIYREIRKEEEKMRSHSFFPGDLVLVYPNIKEKKQKLSNMRFFRSNYFARNLICKL